MTKEQNDQPKPIFPGFGFLANWENKMKEGGVVTAQCTLHALQRQAFQNAKTAIDLGVGHHFLDDLRKKGLGVVTKGLSARFGYVFLTMLPANAARREFADLYPQSSPYTQAALATTIETLPGAAFEADAAKAVMKRAGVELSDKPLNFFDPKFRAAYSAAVIPYSCRNGLGWLAAFMVRPEGEIKAGERFMIGAFAGAVSAPLDTIGSRMMMQAARNQQEAQSLATTVAGAAVETIGNIFRDPKEFARVVGKGAAFRALPGGVAALIFSDKGAEVIGDSQRVMLNALVALGESAQSVFDGMFKSDEPKKQAEKASAQRVQKEENKTR